MLTVELENLTKRYGARTILGGVTATFSPGQTVALVGPSGGGKSTLLRCINGLATFEEGEIRVGPHRLGPAGTEGHYQNAHEIRLLFGMIFQDFQLFPHLTALENIIEAPLRVLNQSPSEARHRGLELLARVGLGDRGGAYPKELSGGQKQRVAIARALAMNPRGLLCDEITSALDPELKHEVLEVLEALKAEGLTLIVVTHEMGFARRCSDRVCVLAEGRILEEGPPESVLENPQHERTQKFLRRVLA